VPDYQPVRLGQGGEGDSVLIEQAIEALARRSIVTDTGQAAAAPGHRLTDEHRAPVRASIAQFNRTKLALRPFRWLVHAGLPHSVIRRQPLTRGWLTCGCNR
jgi:hypothetical protein